MADEKPLTEDDIVRILDARLKLYGLDPDKADDMRERIRFVNKYMGTFQSVGRWTGMTIVAGIVTAIMYVVVEGLRAFFTQAGPP